MTTLFDSRRPVNSLSHTGRPFGRGLESAAGRPARFVPTAADRAWAAYWLNKDCTDYDVIAPAAARGQS